MIGEVSDAQPGANNGNTNSCRPLAVVHAFATLSGTFSGTTVTVGSVHTDFAPSTPAELMRGPVPRPHETPRNNYAALH